jgi:hypothetical protein
MASMDIKYHINDKGEVHRCKARVKCRFGGATGVENHYSSLAEAEVAAQKTLTDNYGSMGAVQRATPSPQFTRTREAIRAALVRYSAVENGSVLPEVATVQELVAKWFAGDRARYTTFRQLSENEDLADATKTSIGGFFKGGFSVSVSSTADALPTKKQASKFSASEIDLLDDAPEGKLDREALLGGRLKAFG